VLSYRTGAYAPNGIPFANGYVDYLKLVNARDGGINGVKITYEECETGYATDKGVECYERLKGKGSHGATAFHPLSTGITFAVTDKSFVDKIPIITFGYGRADSVDGSVFGWNSHLAALTGRRGHAGTARRQEGRRPGQAQGQEDRARLPRLALRQGADRVLETRAKMHGYELLLLPVTHPGVEQKATWLQIRQQRPDYVFLWGWGVMNSTSIKEAVATGYPREKMYGVWWSGAEPDVTPAGEGAKGYSALVFLAPAGQGQVHKDMIKYRHDKGQGTGKKEEIGEVLYNRGMLSAHDVTSKRCKRRRSSTARSRSRARKCAGAGEPGDRRRGDQEARLRRLHDAGEHQLREPRGESQATIHTWDGKKWIVEQGTLRADTSILKPMIRASAEKYAAEKKLVKRDCAKEAG
jgi:branched-chain amino acid transport system substrate-binding protein